MAKDNQEAKGIGGGSAREQISNFVKGFGRLSVQFSDNARQLVEEEENAPLVDTYRDVLTAQISGLDERLTAFFLNADPEGLSEAEDFLRISGGAQLVEQALNLVGKDRLRSRNALGRFGGIFELIKKIITQLVDLIFGQVPRWLDKLLHLVDNLLGLIAGLFSDDAQQYYYRLERNEYRIRKDLNAIGA